MTKLTERYPHALRLSEADTLKNEPDNLYQLIAPYLDWELAEIDMQSTDMLLLEPARTGDASQLRGMVIVSGKLGSVWLQHSRSTKPKDNTVS